MPRRSCACCPPLSDDEESSGTDADCFADDATMPDSDHDSDHNSCEDEDEDERYDPTELKDVLLSLQQMAIDDETKAAMKVGPSWRF